MRELTPARVAGTKHPLSCADVPARSAQAARQAAGESRAVLNKRVDVL